MILLDEGLVGFEKAVFRGLENCKIDLKNPLSFGAGVSGGADSVSLLVSLARLSKVFGFKLKVLSVNHNIRSEEESLSDSVFVMNLCSNLKDLGFDVEGTIVSLEKGLVFKEAEKRRNGIEEAARFLRYNEFKKFIDKENIDYFCVAHNENDRLETVLMRFLQGSVSGSLSGISSVRGKIIRPLLGIQRCEIESYLNYFGIKWRTDSTNSDDNYLRNRIRNKLVPFLNEEFPFWKESVLNGIVKNLDDEEALRCFTDKAYELLADDKNCENSLKYEEKLGKENEVEKHDVRRDRGKVENNDKVEARFSLSKIVAFPLAVRQRIFFESLSKLGLEKRFPYKTIRRFSSELDSCVDENGNVIKERSSKVKLNALGFDFFIEDKDIIIKKNENKATENRFFVIIEDSGSFLLPFGSILVQSEGNKADIRFENEENGKSFVLKNQMLPLCIRSHEISDYVLTKDAGKKSVSDVFSQWKVPSDLRWKIPLVSTLGDGKMEISYVIGSLFGFSDWIFRGNDE